MANALAASSSPYLRQHAENPVDWRPWSAEALAEAAERDVPLLISIGYSACHWCHVMAHESFEDPQIAAQMNAGFVCIKVDREERPDLDAIYMDACQAITGQGGWPLNAFATPDGKPFHVGTYFPARPGRGLPAWPQVLEAVTTAWREDRAKLTEQSDQLTARLVGAANLEPAAGLPGPEVLDAAIATLQGSFDSLNGGFGGAPKFPPSTTLGLLLRRRELPMARYTLHSMASGGIFDQLAGGFSRYAVDATWTVPHFEKMLFDNALLAARYAEAQAITGDRAFGVVAERTLDWMLADLGDPDGALASALDADSEGVEGAYYVWTPAQLREVLSDGDAAVAASWFGVTEHGNFDGGASVLEARGIGPGPQDGARIIGQLLAAREQRAAPGRDGKRVVSWNALAIIALAKSGVLLDRPDHLQAATRAATVILARARDERGRLLRLIPFGDAAADRAGIPDGVLEDHAHLLEALVELYEATFDPQWLTAARALASVLLRDFEDPARGGFFATGAGHEQLVARRKDLDDNPIPSGQASAALALLRLHALTADAGLLEAAEGVLRLGSVLAAKHPHAFSQLLSALDQYQAPPREIAIVGEGPAAKALLAVARERGGPGAVIAAGAPLGKDDPAVPLLAGRGLVNGQPAAYVCERFRCQAPVTDPAELAALLD